LFVEIFNLANRSFYPINSGFCVKKNGLKEAIVNFMTVVAYKLFTQGNKLKGFCGKACLLRILNSNMAKHVFIICVWIGMALLSCQNHTPDSLITNETIMASASLKIDSGKTVFFGHQSVGNDLVDGIRLIDENSTLIETGELDTIQSKGGFYHSKIGCNRQPLLKLSSFARFVKTNNEQLCVAGMKFCYVDITASTNVDSFLLAYKTQLDELEKEFPHIRFFHVTVPVRSVKSGFMARVKEIILKNDYGKKDNIARERFNSLMRSTYTGNLFDLAHFEATSPDGTLNSFGKDSTFGLSLCDVYTSDGGHLNELGKIVLAGRFICFLNSLI
jgi:hypothetical protein